MDSCLTATLHVLVNHRGSNSLPKCELENQMPFFLLKKKTFLSSLIISVCTVPSVSPLSKNMLCMPGTHKGTAHLTAPRVNHWASLRQVRHPGWPSGWLVLESLASKSALRCSDFFYELTKCQGVFKKINTGKLTLPLKHRDVDRHVQSVCTNAASQKASTAKVCHIPEIHRQSKSGTFQYNSSFG